MIVYTGRSITFDVMKVITAPPVHLPTTGAAPELATDATNVNQRGSIYQLWLLEYYQPLIIFLQLLHKWTSHLSLVITAGVLWLLIPPIIVGYLIEGLFILPTRGFITNNYGNINNGSNDNYSNNYSATDY